MGYNTRKACFRYIQESQDQDRDWLNRYILAVDALSGIVIDFQNTAASAPATGSLTDGDIGKAYLEHDGMTPAVAQYFHIWGGSYLGLISVPAFPTFYYNIPADTYHVIDDELDTGPWTP